MKTSLEKAREIYQSWEQRQPESCFADPQTLITDFAKAFDEYEQKLSIAREALEFYKNIKDNHTLIFDDEGNSRAEVYEKYKKHSIGDLGIKAREALEELKP
jgi:hypothetical protein